MHANLSTQNATSTSKAFEPRSLQAKRPLKRQAAGTLAIALALTLTTGLINPVYQRAWAVNTPSKPQPAKAATKAQNKPAGKKDDKKLSRKERRQKKKEERKKRRAERRDDEKS